MPGAKSRAARGGATKDAVRAKGGTGVGRVEARQPTGRQVIPRQDPEAVRYVRKTGVVVRSVRRKGVGEFVTRIHSADPLQLVATERDGVASMFVKDLAGELGIPAQRMFSILGVPKATAEKKIASGKLLAGSGGRAALGIARLLGMAQAMVGESTAPGARNFDAARWLGEWLERPQPALGGRKPADLIDTPTGLAVVTRLLGAVASGAYQ